MKQALTIVLSSVGTTGDVEPYRALGLALAERGHRVRMLSHPMHAARFEAVDLEFRGVAAAVDQAGFNQAFDQIFSAEADPLRQFTMLVHDVFLREAEAQLEAQLEATADADLAVVHCFDFVGQEALRRHHKRWASVFMMPEVIESAEAPPYPLPRLGRWFARVAWQAAAERAKAANQAVVARLARAGITTPALGIAGAVSPHLNLVAASPSLIQVRGDWPSTFAATGHWHRASEPEALPLDLSAFINEHGAPVVVTFGSMGGGRGRETTEIVGAALRRLGHPAIVQLGYQGLELRGPALFSAGFVPHAPLFERAAVVVHHAGAGTSHMVCRAGVPSVAVPHMFDQYYWAGMLHRVGVAPKPLWRGPLQADKLAAAIRKVLADRKTTQRARELGLRMQAERGVDRAVALIEALTPQG